MAAFSPQGTQAVTGDVEGVLRVWDLKTGKSGRKLRACKPAEPVDYLAFSSSGNRWVSLGFGCVRIWSSNGFLVGEIERVEGSRCALMPGGTGLVVGRKNAIDVWDLGARLMANSLRLEGITVTSIVALPDDRNVLIGCSDGSLRLFALDERKERWSFPAHASDVSCMTSAPDGTRTLTGGADGEVIEWESLTGNRIRAMTGHTARISALAYSHDGKLALSSDDNKRIKLWDLESGFLVRTLKMPESSAVGIGFSPDGLRAYAGSRPIAVRLWDLSSGEELQHE